MITGTKMFVSVMLIYLEVFKVAAWLAFAPARLDVSPMCHSNGNTSGVRYQSSSEVKILSKKESSRLVWVTTCLKRKLRISASFRNRYPDLRRTPAVSELSLSLFLSLSLSLSLSPLLSLSLLIVTAL